MISTNIATQKQCLYVLQLHEYLIKTAISWFPVKVHFYLFLFFFRLSSFWPVTRTRTATSTTRTSCEPSWTDNLFSDNSLKFGKKKSFTPNKCITSLCRHNKCNRFTTTKNSSHLCSSFLLTELIHLHFSIQCLLLTSRV